MARSLIQHADSEVNAFLDAYLDASPSVEAYTSGSTSEPKRIALPKALMRASARATNAIFNIREGDLLLCPLAARYIAARMMMVRALEAGARCLMLPPSSRPLEHWDGSEEVALLPVVPAQVEGLLSEPDKCRRIRNVIVGGGALSAARERALMQAPFRTKVSYGMTETCSHVALRDLDKPYYSALPAYEFSLDERGCLVIDRTDEIALHLVTNDMVRLLDSHTFEWLGRYDNVVNSGGIKFFPEQFEKLLQAELPADSFYLTSRASSRWGEELVAVILDDALCDDDFLDACHRLLPSRYAIPKAIFREEARFTAHSAKLRRKKY